MSLIHIGYDYVVRSYQDDTFMLETVHKGDHSKDLELLVIERCGRRAEVFRVLPNGDLESIPAVLPSWWEVKP